MLDGGAAQTAAEAPAGSDGRGHVPGEEGVWVFILGDMFVFSLLFGVYTYYFRQAPDLFIASQAQLEPGLGLAYTVLLLSSSWFVVLAMRAVRAVQPRLAAWCFALAFACGAGFAGLKGVEYADKAAAGITPMTNDFFMYYFVLTGIHLMHVVIGLVLLVFVMRAARRGLSAGGDRILVETGASYWHMVDLLWVVLFALLYLMH